MTTDSSGSRSSRRDVLKYTGTGLATTSLAGCMSYLNAEEASRSGGQSTPSTGEGVADDAFAGRTFKLGLLTAPANTEFGAAMINSAKMAASELNKNGGILGGDVEIISANTQLQSARAKRQYRRLTRREDVDATMGTLSGSSLRAILRPMSDAERIHLTTASADPLAAELVSKKVSPIGGNPEQEYEKYKYHFRPGPINSKDLQSSFIEFIDLYAEEFGWDSAAVLIENSNTAESYVKALEKRASDLIDIPIAKVTSSSTTNWTPIYDELEDANVDVALVVQVLSGISSVKQWASQEREFAFGGIHIRAQLPTFWKATGGAAESVFTMNAVTPKTTNTPQTQPFMEKYDRRFGGIPFFAGPITYDAVKEFATAIKRTGYDPKTETDELIDYMESPEFVFTDGTIIPAFGFRGPNQRFAHDPIWDCMTQCEGKLEDDEPHGPTGVPVWQQWQPEDDGSGGAMEAFAPKSNKTADYIRPPWMR